MTEKIIVAAIILIVALMFWGSYQDAKNWEKFKVEHHCVETGIIHSSTAIGVGVSDKGGTTVMPITTPEKHTYTCDGGYQVTR